MAARAGATGLGGAAFGDDATSTESGSEPSDASGRYAIGDGARWDGRGGCSGEEKGQRRRKKRMLAAAAAAEGKKGTRLLPARAPGESLRLPRARPGRASRGRPGQRRASPCKAWAGPRRGKGRRDQDEKKKNPLTPSSAAPHQKNLLPFSQRGRLLDRLVHLPARQRVFLCGGRGLHPGRLQPGGPERAGEEREEGRRRGREKVGCFFFNLGPPHDFSSSPVSLLALSLALLLRSPTTTTPWTSSWTPTPPPRTP